MHFGAAMFFTDASMTPSELGPLLEERGFESLWVPEHSHIPLVRTKPFPAAQNCRGPITTSWTHSWCSPRQRSRRRR